MNNYFIIILYVAEKSEKMLTFCIVAIFREHSEWNNWEKMYLFLTWLEFSALYKVLL